MYTGSMFHKREDFPQIKTIHHRLIFKSPGGTSRGVLNDKDSWYLLSALGESVVGIGEASLISGLSPDDSEHLPGLLANPAESFDPCQFPAVAFAIETWKISVACDQPFLFYENAFTRGEYGIPINGLIWMGERRFMYDQIREKLEAGFRCIKLKIGAIDFEQELSLLAYIRSQFPVAEVELRVDANGAFSTADALEKLRRLSDYHLHSIEQPIKPGYWEDMAQLCVESPVAIALDEELIGVRKDHIVKMLDSIRPPYIILKPSLLGGLAASKYWVDMAENLNIGWWVTSALESNVGLNAIAQWTSDLGVSMPQGLGTGMLYTNNISSPLEIRGDRLFYNPERDWDTSLFTSSSM